MWILLTVMTALVVAGIAGLVITAEDFNRPIDFSKKLLHNRPNQYLVCPTDHCHDEPHEIAPTFDMPAKELSVKFAAVLKSEQRLKKLSDNAGSLIQNYRQSSAAFRFPDKITVEFVALSTTTSSLAIYSRSKYGRRDFNVNKIRVKRWLRKLGEKG